MISSAGDEGGLEAGFGGKRWTRRTSMHEETYWPPKRLLTISVTRSSTGFFLVASSDTDRRGRGVEQNARARKSKGRMDFKWAGGRVLMSADTCCR